MKLPYLTKECDNDTFHAEYQRRLEKVQASIDSMRKEIKELKATCAQIDAEIDTHRGDEVKLFPLFQKKRNAKNKIKTLEEKLTAAESQKQRIKHNDGSMRGWELMFKNLNIDNTQRKIQEDFRLEELTMDPFHSQIIDKRRLNKVKRGMNLLVPLPNMRLNYKSNDQKYNTEDIATLGKDYSVVTHHRLLAAKEKVKHKLIEDRRRIVNLTKSKKYGSAVFLNGSQTARSRLHDELRLMKDDESEDASQANF